MKKLLPMLLLILCLVFTACTGDATTTQKPDGGKTPSVDVSGVKKDPLGAIAQAIQNTVSKQVTDETGLGAVIEETLADGTVSVHFASDMLFSQMGLEDVAAMDAVWYTKALTQNALQFTLTDAEGGESSVGIWVGPEAIAVNGDLIFGDETAYQLNLSDLSDVAWLMSLADILSQYSAEIPNSDQLGSVLDYVEQMGSVDLSGFLADTAWITDVITAIQPTIKAEGANAVLTYNLSVDNLAKVAKTLINKLPITDELVAQICEMLDYDAMTVKDLRDYLNTMIDEAITEIKKEVNLSCTLKFAINVAKQTLANITLDMKSSEKGSKDAQTIKLSCDFTDSGITAKLKINTEGETVDMTYSVNKKTEGDKITNTAKWVATIDGETGSITATQTYNKKSGEFGLSVNANIPSDEAINATLGYKGKITKAADKTTIALTNVFVQGVGEADISINLDLSVTLQKGAVIPAMPENAIDVKTLTPEEIEAILESLGLSKSMDMWETYVYSDEDGTYTLDFYGDQLCSIAELADGSYIELWSDFTIADGYIYFSFDPSMEGEGTIFKNEVVTFVFNDDGSITVDGATFELVSGELPGPGGDEDYTGMTLSGTYLQEEDLGDGVVYTMSYIFEENILTLAINGEEYMSFVYELVGNQIIVYMIDELGNVSETGEASTIFIGDGYIVIDETYLFLDDEGGELPGPGGDEDYTGMILDGYYASEVDMGDGTTTKMGYLFDGNDLYFVMDGEILLQYKYEFDGNKIVIYDVDEEGNVNSTGVPNPFAMGDGYIVIGESTLYLEDMPGHGGDGDYTGTVLSGYYSMLVEDSYYMTYFFEGDNIYVYIDDFVIMEGKYEIIGNQIIAYVKDENGNLATEGDSTSFAMGDGYIVINGDVCEYSETLPEIGGGDIPGGDLPVAGPLSGTYVAYPDVNLEIAYIFEGNTVICVITDDVEETVQYALYELNEDWTEITFTMVDENGNLTDEDPVSASFFMGDGYITVAGNSFFLDGIIPGEGEDYTGTILSGFYAKEIDMGDGTVMTMGYLFEGNLMEFYVGGDLYGSAAYEIVGSEIFAYPIDESGDVSTEGDPASFAMGDGYIIIEGDILYLVVEEALAA